MKRIFVVLLAATTVWLGACGGGGTATTTAPPAEGSAGGPIIQVGPRGFLVDGQGRTLYLFTNDEGGTPSCYDTCADDWPPVPAPATAGDGVDPSRVGSVERRDGASQATYRGWPLYYYAADFVPGDANGQGVNGVWWVVSPDGEALTDDLPSSADYGY
jgi:predicted lipoprotein with Yx(FWY)xxD motif